MLPILIEQLQCIDRAAFTCLCESVPLGVRRVREENRDTLIVEFENLRRYVDAVAESNAQGAVYLDGQRPEAPFIDAFQGPSTSLCSGEAATLLGRESVGKASSRVRSPGRKQDGPLRHRDGVSDKVHPVSVPSHCESSPPAGDLLGTERVTGESGVPVGR